MMHTPTVHTRIGLIIPSSNRLTEAHMHRYAPAGVAAHVTRLRMTGAHHVRLGELMPRIVEATLALNDAGCSAIVFHCTASSMEAGLAGEEQVLSAMRSATDAVTATTATAALAALNALELGRIALLSPYVATTHQHEVEFLAEAGHQVVGGKCLGLRGGDEYITVTPGQWLRLAVTNTPRDAEGVFLSCTNIHAPEIVQELETVLEKPVVTSNQAVLWYVLRSLGIENDLPELGRLFRVRQLEAEVAGRTL